MTQNELSHHGIIGQKWGIRRYQNKDGSLTNAGKKRYNGGSSIDIIEANKDRRIQSKLAEQQYKGEKLRKAALAYKADIIKKHPDRAEKYNSMSEEDIEKEFIRRENMKTALKYGAVAVGLGTAMYIAYRMSLSKQINDTEKCTAKDIKNALDRAQEDLDYCFSKGYTLHRQVGYENFDLTKNGSKALYATTNRNDTNTYMALLKDFNNTGKRYDVTLKATTQLLAPSDKKAREIFDEVWNSNPQYREHLKNTIAQVYKENGFNEQGALAVASHFVEKDPFYAGVYAICKQGADTKILQNEYIKRGYNALIDYHDVIDGLSKQPLILLDPQNTLTKIGEEFVSASDKTNALHYVALHGTDLARAVAQRILFRQ